MTLRLTTFLAILAALIWLGIRVSIWWPIGAVILAITAVCVLAWQEARAGRSKLWYEP